MMCFICLSVARMHQNIGLSHFRCPRMGPFPFNVPNFYSAIFKLDIVLLIEPQHEIFNNVVCVTSKASDQTVHTRSLTRAFASRLNILQHMEFLSLLESCMSLHWSKCHVVGQHMPQLIIICLLVTILAV